VKLPAGTEGFGMDDPEETRKEFSRRALIKGGAIAAVTSISGVSEALAPKSAPDSPFVSRANITLEVNGVSHRVEVEPRSTLLDVLRERLYLTGTKKGCNRGECGACTIHLDGRRVNGCLVLAIAADGKKIETIEGLAKGDQLHPMQQAFIDHDAFQCGYCTSGQIMSAVACVTEGHTGSNSEIREWMSGNICRCSAYPQIAAAVNAVAKRNAQ
jgi:xanthine dehydrogenase YagT iron-sulfur-binding subunit